MTETQDRLEPAMIDRVLQLRVTRDGSRRVDTYVRRAAAFYELDSGLHVWFHGQPVALHVGERETLEVTVLAGS